MIKHFNIDEGMHCNKTREVRIDAKFFIEEKEQKMNVLREQHDHTVTV